MTHHRIDARRDEDTDEYLATAGDHLFQEWTMDRSAVIREITQDKTTVFYVKFDDPDGNDFYDKYVGSDVLVDDLYALNGGGPNP